MTQSSEYSFTCVNAASTADFGAKLGQVLETGDVILLYGDLGAGKTTLTRGLIQSLSGQDTTVVSPTFTLVQTYPTPKGVIYHYDFYRLPQGAASALEELGWQDGLMTGIILAEWPDRLIETPPDYALLVSIVACPDGSRLIKCRVKCQNDASWQLRLENLQKASYDD